MEISRNRLIFSSCLLFVFYFTLQHIGLVNDGHQKPLFKQDSFIKIQRTATNPAENYPTKLPIDISPDVPEKFLTESPEMVWAEQNIRLNRIRETCEKLNLTGESPLKKSTVLRLLATNKYRVLFGYIPKNGCTTWKGVFSKVRKSRVRDEKEECWRLGACNQTIWEEKLKTYTKAFFVRNPLVRFLSAYLSKFTNQRNLQHTWERMYGKAIVKQFRANGSEIVAERIADDSFLNVTLEEWARYVIYKGENINLHEISDHWLPQYIVGHPCQVKYDFVGKYENLAKEAPFMLHWLGIDEAVQHPPVHVSNAMDKLVDGYKNMPDDLLLQLSQFYWKDFLMFGYNATTTMKVIRGELKDVKYLL